MLLRFGGADRAVGIVPVMLTILMTATLSHQATAQPLPPSPRGLTLKVTDDGLEVSWDAVTGAAKYVLDRRKDGKPDQVFDNLHETRKPQTDLSAGASYSFRVAWVDAAGTQSRWSPILSTQAAPAPDVFQITAPRNGQVIPRQGASVEWTKAPGISDYEVTVKRLPSGTKIISTTQPSATSYRLPPEYTLSLGSQYSVDVVGITPDKKRIDAGNGAQTVTVPSFFDAMKKATGITIQRAYGPDGKQGATFSFVDGHGSDPQYSADFVVISDLRKLFGHQGDPTEVPSGLDAELRGDAPRLAPEFSFEGHIAPNDNKDKKSQDSMTARFGFELDRSIPQQRWGYYASAAVKYQTDSDLDTEVAAFEFKVSPSVPALAIGSGVPLEEIWDKLISHAVTQEDRDRWSTYERRSGPWLRWRPVLSVDAGKATDLPRPDPGKPKPNRDVFRIYPSVDAQLIFPHALSLEYARLFATDRLYWLPLGNERTHQHNFFQSGVEFYFTPNVSLGVTYKAGADAPDFTEIHSWNIGIGVKM